MGSVLIGSLTLKHWGMTATSDRIFSDEDLSIAATFADNLSVKELEIQFSASDFEVILEDAKNLYDKFLWVQVVSHYDRCSPLSDKRVDLLVQTWKGLKSKTRNRFRTITHRSIARTFSPGDATFVKTEEEESWNKIEMKPHPQGGQLPLVIDFISKLTLPQLEAVLEKVLHARNHRPKEIIQCVFARLTWKQSFFRVMKTPSHKISSMTAEDDRRLDYVWGNGIDDRCRETFGRTACAFLTTVARQLCKAKAEPATNSAEILIDFHSCMPKEENRVYFVEEILERCRIEGMDGRYNKNYLYRVKWYGYEETTWEPWNNLNNCQQKLKEFNQLKRSKTRFQANDPHPIVHL